MPPTKTVIEWPYTPTDLFEEAFNHSDPAFDLEVKDGIARAVLTTPQDPIPADLRAQVERLVTAVLDARALLFHRVYSLVLPRTIQEGASATRTVQMSLGSSAVLTKANLDLQVKNALGEVVQDTAAQRRAAEKAFVLASYQAAQKTPVAGQLLASYTRAVRDPENELVHLYEIREALSTFFGGEAKACKALGISKKEWQDMGKLANHEPIEQGRHRGKDLAGRRPATSDELNNARELARVWIERFFAIV